MGALITRQRLIRLAGFASTQMAVQLIGFAAGIVLVRYMAQAQYGYYTLAVSLTSMAIIFTDLGLATAVLAIGGRLVGRSGAVGALVLDANAMHRRMALIAYGVLLPCFGVLLLRQHAALWQVVMLTAIIGVTAVLGVRAGLALQVVRLLGHVGVQQKLDLGVNLSKLGLLCLAAWFVLDATVACLVNLGVAAASFWVLTRHVRRHVETPQQAEHRHNGALRAHLWKQAPNSIYYVISSQLALWLIGVFGSAERVAEVGALSRLGALFAVIGAVTAALILPYFARHDDPAHLAAGFASVNAFYAMLLAVLLTLAVAVPAPILWVLGNGYAQLQAELVWMVAASTLATWGGAIYSIGCARGWVLPIGLTLVSGVLATAAAAAAVDVSTVRGSFMINTASGLVSTLVAISYFAWQLRSHMRRRAAGAFISAARP